VKEFIDTLQRDEKKLREEVESIVSITEIINQVGTSNDSSPQQTVNDKGKSKEVNDNQSELQAVIVDKTHDYGSINNK
jgi:hypothetical protein